MRVLQHTVTRCSRYLSSSSLSSRMPWFIDSSEASLAQKTPSQKGTFPPLPHGIPVALQTLHAQLAQSPYLEPSKLLVRDPIPQPPGPPLPLSAPRGRRKRGGTYSGEGLLDPGNLWNWIVLAQVRLILVIPCHAIAYIPCRSKRGQRNADPSNLSYGSSEKRYVVEHCQQRQSILKNRTVVVHGPAPSALEENSERHTRRLGYGRCRRICRSHP